MCGGVSCGGGKARMATGLGRLAMPAPARLLQSWPGCLLCHMRSSEEELLSRVASWCLPRWSPSELLGMRVSMGENR